jgi:hypothetical protein
MKEGGRVSGAHEHENETWADESGRLFCPLRRRSRVRAARARAHFTAYYYYYCYEADLEVCGVTRRNSRKGTGGGAERGVRLFMRRGRWLCVERFGYA